MTLNLKHLGRYQMLRDRRGRQLARRPTFHQPRSKIMPHQGRRECERRLRQAKRVA